MKKVLIVEDDSDKLNALAIPIHEWGYEVAGANTAQEALSSISRSCPDVLISDLNLPDMKGIDLLKTIRQSPCEEITFFLITKIPSVQIAIDAIFEGAQEVLLKPIDFEKLHKLLDQWTSHEFRQSI